MKLSTRDLPMFFEPAHVALGERLERSLEAGDEALEDPTRVVPRLAELDLLRYAVPSASPHRVDVRSLCLVREALGQISPLADSIFAVQGLGSHPIVLSPAFPGRDLVLARLSAGEITAGFALTEPEAGSDVAALRTSARREGDEWVLDGEKIYISNVGIAHAFTVFARVEPAPAHAAAPAPRKTVSAFWVPAHAAGLTLEPMGLAGGGRHPLGRLRMKDCRIPASALLGEVGAGLRLGLGTLDVFRTSVGAAAVGMARRALDESIAHAKARVQFQKRLADFQLTQAALAEMATDLDAARLLVYRAAWDKDVRGAKSPDAPPASGARPSAIPVAMAKMFATEAAQRVIDRAVQLHGGSGVVEASVVGDLYRDIRPLRIYEGTTEIQKLIIGGELVS
jgi:acyl-CoA dehydrogenase